LPPHEQRNFCRQKSLHTKAVDQDAIRSFIASEFADVRVQIAGPDDGSPEMAWGDTFFMHKDDAHQFPFATIVTKDYGDFDNLSNLNRPDVWRLNIGVSKETFDRLFPAGQNYDFAASDVLMPHPVYGPNHFVCILNPSDPSFQEIRPLLDEAYRIAAGRVERRGARRQQKSR
jgi:uncharacterized protein DUF6194